jgi:hypothetical protein
MVQNWKDFASSDETTLSHGGNVDGEAFLGVLVGKMYQRRPSAVSSQTSAHQQVIKTTNNQQNSTSCKNIVITT